jgi:hypothetical protein
LLDHVRYNVNTSELKQIESEYLATCNKVVVRDEWTPFAVLASVGLIGWPASDVTNHLKKQFFARPGSDRQLRVPGTTNTVLVHPILYGGEYNIETKKGLVVGPGLPYHQ